MCLIGSIIWCGKLERLAPGTKSVECSMTLENLDFGPNTYHKEKGDGVDNRGGRKQIMTVGSAAKVAEKVMSTVEQEKKNSRWQL